MGAKREVMTLGTYPRYVRESLAALRIEELPRLLAVSHIVTS
jgi:hypothetical protein